MPRAIVIVVDRLGSGFLGTYGNTWVITPAINRFASESILWEHCLSDSPQLASTCHTYWTGMHSMQLATAAGPQSPSSGLPGQLANADIPTVLISDELDVVNHPLVTGFAETILIPEKNNDVGVDSIEETQCASVLAYALQWLEKQPADASFLAWIHLRAMQGPWDAPHSFRELFHDEEDPDLPTWTIPPEQQNKSFDPDDLLSVTQAYAGQISALDSCLDVFWQTLDELPSADNTLTALTSPRGFPLGQHGRVGACDHPLYGELLNVPCMLQLPNQQQATKRIQSLVQPGNLYATLLQWFEQQDPLTEQRTLPSTLIPAPANLANNGHWPASTSRAVALSHQQLALRTPAWFLHQTMDQKAELYVKPDDRWEINDVANRCPDIVEQMTEQLQLCQERFQGGCQDPWPPLPELLAVGLE
jgi:arylsulfatase A-like enzyme